MRKAKFNAATFVLMGILTLVLAGMTVYGTATGDTALFPGPAVYIILGLYSIAQIICVLLYKPGKSVYKIGFYFVHIGVLLMLAGFLLYALVGQALYATAPVDPSGNFYNTLVNDEGEKVELGFGFRVNTLEIDRYESGGEKMYRSELQYIDKNGLTGQYIGQGDKATLEVNKTFRHSGWKIYLMSCSDHEYSRDGQFYLMPASLGKDGVVPRQEIGRIEAENGTSALAKLLADGQYGSGTLEFYIYDGGSDTYVRCASSALATIGGRTVVRIYGGEGVYSVYASGSAVMLLIKQDPGEYFVIAGMIFTVTGVIMMCLIKGKTGKEPEDEKTGAKSGSAPTPEGRPAKGSDKR